MTPTTVQDPLQGLVVPAVPATPAPATPPPAPHRMTQDEMAESLRNKMLGNAAPAPPATQGTPGTTPAAPQDPNSPAPVPAAPAAAGTPAPTEPASFNLDEFDFDNPDSTTTPGSTPSTPVTPGAPGTSTSPETPEETATIDAIQRSIADGSLLPNDIIGELNKTSRGKRYYSAFQTLRSLEQPIEQGGIGFMPTTEQITQYYQDATAWEQMMYEFETNPTSWMMNFIRPDQSGQIPRSVQHISQTFLSHLAKVDRSGQLFVRAADPAIKFYINDLRAAANTTPDGTQKDEFGVDVKTRLLDAATILEQRHSIRSAGRVNLPNPPAGSPGALATSPTTPGQAQPSATEAEAERLRKEYETRLARMDQEMVFGVQSGISDSVSALVEADVEKLLTATGIKSSSPTPKIYDMVKQDLTNQVIQAVSGDQRLGKAPSNPSGFTQFQIAVGRTVQAVQSNQPQAVREQYRSSAVAAYHQMARTTLRLLGKDFVRTTGSGNLTAATPTLERQARLNSAAAQTEVPASGPAVTHSLAPAIKLEVQPGESKADAMSRFLAQRMSAGRSA